jgi:hypothetical protein
MEGSTGGTERMSEGSGETEYWGEGREYVGCCVRACVGERGENGGECKRHRRRECMGCYRILECNERCGVSDDCVLMEKERKAC